MMSQDRAMQQYKCICYCYYDREASMMLHDHVFVAVFHVYVGMMPHRDTHVYKLGDVT